MPTLLDDFEREDHNALYSAIQECGIDDAIARQKGRTTFPVVLFLDGAYADYDNDRAVD